VEFGKLKGRDRQLMAANSGVLAKSFKAFGITAVVLAWILI
jgi:hypothetical protein